MSAGVANFFKYNLWANQCLLDACEPLSDAQLDASAAGVYGSVREILIHIFTSEEGYAGRLSGHFPEPRLADLPTFPSFDELRRRAQWSGDRLIQYAEQGDRNQIFHLDEGTYDAPAFIILLQALNHAIDHRSQIATVLSQQGIELPDLAAWGYNDAVVTPENPR
jgi:uncharacterized damage-inducible protein DinB